VLDLGCGSGILGIGALVLGARSCLGCDIDPKAPDVVRSNAALNGIGADRLTACAGDILADASLRRGFGGGYQLVLANIVDCPKELITQAQPVKLDGLGTFYPTIENDGKKAQTTVEATLEQGLDALIKGIHLRFIPEGAKGEELTSRSLKGNCVLQAAYVVAAKKKTVDGKQVTYQEKIPISSYANATADPDDTPQPETSKE
jgi:SAM-dependent methyltransferase